MTPHNMQILGVGPFVKQHLNNSSVVTNEV